MSNKNHELRERAYSFLIKYEKQKANEDKVLFKKLIKLKEDVKSLKDERLNLEILLKIIPDASNYGEDVIKYIEEMISKHTIDENTLYSYTKNWYYKWYVQEITDDLNYSKEFVLQELRKIERKFLDYNDNKGFLKLSLDVYFNLGEKEKAKEVYLQLKEVLKEEGYLSDCDACIAHWLVYYLFLERDYINANEHANEILDGTLKCDVIPKKSYPIIASIKYKLGKTEESKKIMDKLKKLKNNNKFDIIEGITYYLMNNENKKALKYFNDKIDVWNNENIEDKIFSKFRLLLLMKMILEKQKEKKVEITIPKLLNKKIKSNDNKIEIIEKIEKELEKHMKKIEKRNKNKFFDELKERYVEIIS